jgi:small multidrug resistance pump
VQKWLFLIGAIISEVIGTVSLRATVDHSGWMPVVVVTYITAFALLGLTLRAGIPVGVAYGIWGATGVALVAVLGAVFFGELLSTTTLIGIGLIIVGVVVVETGTRPTRRPASGDTA